METLLIAVGNPLRRDDGAARRVIELLEPLPPGVEVLEVHQLTPEHADEILPYSTVVFLDAMVMAPECTSSDVFFDEIVRPAVRWPGAVIHESSPAEIVALSRSVLGFEGRAWVCGIPGVDFSMGEGLSPLAESCAHKAAQALRELLFTE